MVHKLLIIGCLCISGHLAAQTEQAKPKPTPKNITIPSLRQPYKQIGADMPPVLVTTTNGKTITNNDLHTGANLFIMTFNPTCSHCVDETVMLVKNIALFNKTKILMVTSELNRSTLPDFERTQHLDQYKTFMSGLDSSHYVDNTFVYQSLPQINIYDKKHKLIKFFNGDVPIDSLKPYIQ